MMPNTNDAGAAVMFADTPLFEATYMESMGRPIIFPDDTARTRRTDPVTSHAAADSNTDTVAASQAFVASILTVRGACADHELVQFAENHRILFPDAPHWTPQRLRTARHELTELGKVEDTGLYHLTASGRRAKVWQVAA